MIVEDEKEAVTDVLDLNEKSKCDDSDPTGSAYK
jgi:hypothetical protein